MEPPKTMRKGMHKHKCPECGTVWGHADSCFDRDEAHTCPKCRKEWFGRFYGFQVVDREEVERVIERNSNK